MRKHTAILILVAALAVLMASAATKGLSPREKSEKSRYYYLEGLRLQNEGKGAQAYEMYKHAWQIDPSYPEAATAYGALKMLLADNDVAEPEELRDALELMRPFVDKYPSEYNENSYYAWAASQIGEDDEAIRVEERLAELFPERSEVLLDLADLYARKLNKGKVVEVLDRYEQIEGKSIPISSRKVSFLLSMADTVAARNELESFARAFPNSVDTYSFKGLFYQYINEPDSAASNLLKAEQADPLDGRTKILLASFYKSQGDSVRYDAKVYDSLLSEGFDLSDKLAILTDYLSTIIADSANTERGDHLFEVLYDQYPHEPKVLSLAADYADAQKQYAKAKELISYAIDLAPDESAYYSKLMLYDVYSDNYAGAMDTYRRAREHTEPPTSQRLMYAMAAGMNGNRDEAEKEYLSLIQEVIPGINPSDSLRITPQIRALDYQQLTQASTYFGSLGDLYYQDKEREKAFRAYENAITLMPYNYMTLNNYAYFLAQTDSNLQRAHDMSRQALDSQPDSPTYLDTFAYILFKQKDYQKALEYQQKAVDISLENGAEGDSALFDHLGDIKFFLQDIDGAVEAWEKALAIDKDNKVIAKKIKDRTYYPEENPF